MSKVAVETYEKTEARTDVLTDTYDKELQDFAAAFAASEQVITTLQESEETDKVCLESQANDTSFRGALVLDNEELSQLREEHAMPKVKLLTKDLNLYYGETHALKGVNMDMYDRKVTALIGPSGCGKSTYLKTLNRMNDTVAGVKITGDVHLDGEDIYGKNVDVTVLRKKIGMVFQSPNPFPMSVYDNIAYGPRMHGVKKRIVLDEIVERSLIDAAIWDEVKDRLKKSALGLSGGQQQRLCIARALATQPEILLMDEPTSALDPISTTKIEELVAQLKKKYSIVIVTHNMQQAARISDYTAFFLLGELIEDNATEVIFSRPEDKRTEDYITGRFG